MHVSVCTWKPGEQTVELSLCQRGPRQVQRLGLAFDDACQGLVTEGAAPTHIHVVPQAFVAAPAWDRETASHLSFSSTTTTSRVKTKESSLKIVFGCEVSNVPLVPGFTDSHAGQQLGSAQISEHRDPHLLLPSPLITHVLEGRQRQQGRRRQGGGCKRGSFPFL